jgi:hypothetical protein
MTFKCSGCHEEFDDDDFFFSFDKRDGTLLKFESHLCVLTWIFNYILQLRDRAILV